MTTEDPSNTPRPGAGAPVPDAGAGRVRPTPGTRSAPAGPDAQEGRAGGPGEVDPRRGPLVGAHWVGSLMERMGMEVLEHSAGRTVVSMPVEGNTQSVGILHGGASAALAETAGSLAAQAHARAVAGPEGRAVGVELSVSHIRAVEGGTVRAVARAVHLGRTSTVHVVEVLDERGRLVAEARISNRVLPG